MFERELTLNKFMHNYLRLLASDLTEADMPVTPYPGANPPVWILGHLAVATDYAGRLLGLQPKCPRQWHVMFGPGSKPAELKAPLPSKEELLSALEEGYRRVREAVPSANAEFMGTTHEIELLKPTNLETNGDVLAHLLCTHPSFHVAQLSACRRNAGKPPIV